MSSTSEHLRVGANITLSMVYKFPNLSWSWLTTYTQRFQWQQIQSLKMIFLYLSSYRMWYSADIGVYENHSFSGWILDNEGTSILTKVNSLTSLFQWTISHLLIISLLAGRSFHFTIKCIRKKFAYKRNFNTWPCHIGSSETNQVFSFDGNENRSQNGNEQF